MIKRLLSCICSLLCLLPAAVQAQEGGRFRPGTRPLLDAEDLLSQHFYQLAAARARDASFAPVPTPFDGVRNDGARIRYIAAISSLSAAAPLAIDSALRLLSAPGDAPQHDRLSLAVAQYYFRAGQLAAAIPFYEASGIANLSNTEIADAKFERAYAYFNNHQFAQADTLFQIMKDVPGRYYSPGNYYYGLLAYNYGNFPAALRSFGRIKDEALYRPVVPYYMAEIYYFMGNREQALTEALRLIRLPEKLYYDNELHLLAAQCLFEAGRYGEALPYFEHYYEHTEKIRKEELYEIGYSYYRVNEWKSAIEKFKPLSAARDSLGQTAMYLLGDSYLKTGNKEAARNAFGVCAAMPYSAGQREAALLLHARLSYELGYADDAMRSVHTLLADFPGGKMDAQARVLQSQLYLQTSNYKDAYEALNATNAAAGADYREARARAAYGYALQQMQRQRLTDADMLLTDAMAQSGATGQMLFWKAELAYRQHRYDSAAIYAERYLAMPAPAQDKVATPKAAAAILGYAALETKDFKKAQQAFARSRQAPAVSAAGDEAEITLREADAYFMQKDFANAAPLYAAVMNGHGGASVDYARLQSAIIAGLRGDAPEKERLLQLILATPQPSPYAAEARYELGVAQIGASRFSDAILTLSPLAADKSATVFAPKALLKTGTAHQQLDKDDAALEAYTRIIRDWSSAPERSDALSAIKSIYIERNQPDRYSKLLEDFKLPPAPDAELDAAYYNAAEAQYAAGKWNAAAAAFSRYLQQYPTGASAGKARYYLAGSYYSDKQFRASRAAYDTVLQGPWNAFSQESAIRAADLAMADSAYGDAAKYYRLLAAHAGSTTTRMQAYTGLLRSTARLDDPMLTAAYADTLITLDGLAPAIRDEAQLYVVRRALAAGAGNVADSLLKPLAESANGAVGAEARFYLAQNLLAAGKLKEAEDAASKNIKRSAGYEHWVVKTYLLLGDVLIAEKDYFNARATLQSVAQHAADPVLRAEAARRLDGLKTTEGSKLSNE